MQKKFILLARLFIILLLVQTAGCSTLLDKKINTEETNLVKVSYLLTDNLLKNLRIGLKKDQNIIVASFVDIQRLEESSNFGRLLAEYIASRLAQQGYTVVEVKLRNSIYIKENAGEFILSRKIQHMTQSQKAQAVVAGTYARAKTDVYLSAKILQADNGQIISTFDTRLPLTPNLKAMFKPSSGGKIIPSSPAR